jgi:hypothetical protein
VGDHVKFSQQEVIKEPLLSSNVCLAAQRRVTETREWRCTSSGLNRKL